MSIRFVGFGTARPTKPAQASRAIAAIYPASHRSDPARSATKILPRDAGPRDGTADGASTVSAAGAAQELCTNQNLIEVYPKATLTQLFPDPASPQPASAIRYRDAQGRPVSIEGKPLHPGRRSRAPASGDTGPTCARMFCRRCPAAFVCDWTVARSRDQKNDRTSSMR